MSMQLPQPDASESSSPRGSGVWRHESGMQFAIADDIDQVIESWHLVYTAYRVAGLIPSNPHRIHTAPAIVSNRSAVIYACIRELTISTLTAVVDSDEPGSSLPLDRVYHDELKALRDQGRRLLEVGLFADRRKHLSRTAESLFQLMRYAFFFGTEYGATDFVIGVHPRHARFYTRSFGFEPHGEVKTYSAVNNNPVLLLRGDVARRMKETPLHPALDYFTKNPVAAGAFARRFDFHPSRIARSPIAGFLDDLAQRSRFSQAG